MPRAPARKKNRRSGDLARLEQVKAELSTRLSARQMELESLADRRRRVEEELKTARRDRVTGARQKLEDAARHACRGRRRAGNRWKKFFRIAPTPPNR